MKKIIKCGLMIILLILVVTGCSMNNTPTKRVEEFFNNYKNLSEDVFNQMNEVVESDKLMNDAQKKIYKDILKKQYRNLIYEIKEEEENANKAVVKAEIEVYDYYKVTKETADYYNAHNDEFLDENGMLSDEKYIDYRLDKMDLTDARVKYTIDLSLSKENGIWVLDSISDQIRQKIHGLYAY